MSDHFERSPESASASENLTSLPGQGLLPIVRSRHGRPIRRVSLSPLILSGQSRSNRFDDVVKDTVEFIRLNYSEELGDLRYQIFDAPSIRPEHKRVRRWAVKTEQKTIVIYRLPIERFGSRQRKRPVEIRMNIEFQVFSAAAELIGREPDFFLGN